MQAGLLNFNKGAAATIINDLLLPTGKLLSSDINGRVGITQLNVSDLINADFGLIPGRVVITSDIGVEKKLGSSSTTTEDVGFLTGATSNIQEQIYNITNDKQVNSSVIGETGISLFHQPNQTSKLNTILPLTVSLGLENNANLSVDLSDYYNKLEVNDLLNLKQNLMANNINGTGEELLYSTANKKKCYIPVICYNRCR